MNSIIITLLVPEDENILIEDLESEKKENYDLKTNDLQGLLNIEKNSSSNINYGKIVQLSENDTNSNTFEYFQKSKSSMEQNTSNSKSLKQIEKNYNELMKKYLTVSSSHKNNSVITSELNESSLKNLER